jgi:hypothetical protein
LVISRIKQERFRAAFMTNVGSRHEAEIEPLKLGADNPPLEIW